MFCLHHYQGLIHYPQDRINTQVIYPLALGQVECTVDSKIDENRCKQKKITNPGNGYFIQVQYISFTAV